VWFLLRYLSVRYWLRHRGAFVLAALGVALGVAVFVAIQVANYSVLSAFSASLDAVAGKANLEVRGGSGGVPEGMYARLVVAGDPRIRAMVPRISNTVLSPSLGTSVLVNGVDAFAEEDFRLASERSDSGDNSGASGPLTSLPRERNTESDAAGSGFRESLGFLLDRTALAVSATLAKRHHLKIGSRVEFEVGVRREWFHVVAILDDAASGRAFGGDFAIMDIAAAQEAFGLRGKLTSIDLLVNETDFAGVKQSLRELAPPDAVVGRPRERSEQIGAMLGAFQLNLTALSSIALFVGAFLIYNAMASAVTRRRLEAGILRAVGASTGQLMGLFLVEAAAVGLFGSMLGLGLGLLLAHYTLGAVATTVSELYIAVRARELYVPPWLPWAAPLAGMVLSVLAAIPAAQEAATTSPRSAMTGGTLHHLTEKWAPVFAGCGALLLGFAWVLCRPEISGRAPMVGFLAAGATIGGFAAFAPLLTLYGGRLIRPAAERLGGIEGALAADYLRRALNRSSLAIAALMTSLALTIGMNVMVHSFRYTVENWVDDTISADLFIATSNGFDNGRGPGLPPEVIRYVTTRKSVKVFDTVREADIEVAGQPAVILANQLPLLPHGGRRIRYVSTVNGVDAANAAFLAGQAIVISERLASLAALKAGDNLRLVTPNGPRDFPIAGVFYDYDPDAVLYMNRMVFAKLWDDNQIDGLALYLDGSVTADQFAGVVDRRYGSKYALLLLPNAEIRGEIFRTFDQTFAVTYALQLIALIVAAVGVFNTLVSLLLERSRELASLRAMGASSAQIRKMTLIEFGLLAFLAWLLSVAAGLCLAWQMIFVINRQFFGWTIFWSLPPMLLINALVLAILAGLGAGFWPARSAAKRSLAVALQRE